MPFRFTRWFGGGGDARPRSALEPEVPPHGGVDPEGWSPGWPNRVLGLDLGAFALKVSDGERDHVLSRVVGEDLRDPRLRDLPLPLRSGEPAIRVNGQTFLFGDAAARHSPLAARAAGRVLPDDPHLPVLVLGALAPFAGWERQAFHVVTGVAVDRYPLDREPLAEALRGDYMLETAADHGAEGPPGRRRAARTVRIESVRVIPKAMGTFYDAVLNSIGNLDETPLAQQAVGVIDVGYQSTELAVAHRLEFIDGHAATLEVGVGAAHEAIAQRLRTALGVMKHTHELDLAIQRGALRLAGADHDLRPVAREILGRTAETLIARIDSVWDYRELDAILLTGGGSVALGPYLQARYPNARPVGMPLLAGVRGFVKLGRFSLRAGAPGGTGFHAMASNGRG